MNVIGSGTRVKFHVSDKVVAILSFLFAYKENQTFSAFDGFKCGENIICSSKYYSTD